jgi:hypothetical protein
MKKDLAIIGGLLLLVAAILIFGGGLSSMSFIKNSGEGTNSASKSSNINSNVDILIKTLNINAKIAANPDSRKKGLSKIDSLPIGEGMLFVFKKNGRYSFWMKDMKFPIDIIWIDENKKIVNISANAIPEPKKADKDLTIYDSSYDVLYVLEINAGLSNANHLQVGDVVSFSL